MSRRTLPRFAAAALLISALAVPASAQMPRTDSVSSPDNLAPMPREKAPPFGSAFGPIALDLDFTFSATPQATDTHRQAANPVCGSGHACAQVQPPACCAAMAVSAARPAGTFYRELPGAVVAITFRGDEMKATLTGNDNGAVATFTLTADCAVTKDGTVHGVVTGVDVEAKGDDAKGMDLAAVSFEMQGLVDQPFAFRTKATDGGLMVSNLRVACGRDSASECIPEMGLLVGKYKPACCCAGVPTPKAVKAGTLFQRNVYATEPEVRMQQLLAVPCPAASPCPSPVWNSDRAEQRYAAQASARTAVLPPAVCQAPRAAPCPVQCPLSSDVSEMMMRVFGEMLGGCCNAPPVVSGMTLPSPRYLQHHPQYFPPNPAFPLPRELQAMECQPTPCPVPAPPVIGFTMSGMASPPGWTVGVPPPPPCPAPVRVVVQSTPGFPVPAMANLRKLPIGTWSREVGPIMYTVTIQDGHLTLTASMSAQNGDEMVFGGLVLTADYYVTRDGSGMVGLITGADVTVKGNKTDGFDPAEVIEELPKMQKAVTDKPFALSYRVYGDTLVIGNLRLPPVEDAGGTAAVLQSAAGRYTLAANGQLPAPKLKRVGNARAVPAGALITPDTVPSLETQLGYPSNPIGPVLPPPSAGQVPPMQVPELVELEALRSSKNVCPGVGAAVGNTIVAANGCPKAGAVIGGIAGARVGAVLGAASDRCAESPKKVSIADVVELTKAGLSDTVIVRQIQMTRSTFNLSVADLRHLKSNGVADCVILEMQLTVESDKPMTGESSSGRTRSHIDPNVRMRQLLDQSEDIGQIRNEWRRFWFLDQPDLTVERIHGGII